MKTLASFVSGLLFGTGLCSSGLANPDKVLSFLDVTGAWDASLLVTLTTAVVVTGIGYRLAFRRGAPLFDTAFQIPSTSAVNVRLVVGAGLFGVGWGLVGFCPGPAIVALALGVMPAFVFVGGLLSGMAVARRLSGQTAAPAPASQQAPDLVSSWRSQ